MLFLLLACNWNQASDDSGTPRHSDTPPDDTGETDDTGTEHTGGETGDDTADDSGESGTDDSGTSIPGPELTLEVDADVKTLVRATWTGATVDASLEYRFEGKTWLPAPAVEPGSGVVLGIPSETTVEVRVVDTVDSAPVYSDVESITTGSLPPSMQLPDVSIYDPTLAYDAEYAMISFSGGSGGYGPPWWIQIVDRDGRVVWYRQVPDNLMAFSPTVALDGTHIWFDATDIFGTGSGDPFVQRQTLDGRWVVEQPIDNLGQAITEGPDRSWFYEYRVGWGGTVALAHMEADGSKSILWDCTDVYDAYDCWLNTCNWSESHNTLLASAFESSTVFEVDVDTGKVVRQMGQMDSTHGFDPEDSMFDYQHFPYWLPSGNLLTSTHDGTHGKQIAAEYEVDDATKTLTRVWSYVSTDIWAEQVGEAVRLPNGNTIQGYGQNGGAREVTPDGDVVWQILWVTPPQQRTVGHMSLIPDLYALNVGGEAK
jgi:hypothetical protein